MTVSAELRAIPAEPRGPVVEMIVFPPSLRDRLADVRASVLSRFQDASDSLRRGGDLAVFRGQISRIRAWVREPSAELSAVRRSAMRVVLSLLGVFAVFGAGSALAYSLYSLINLRRDLGQAVSRGRSFLAATPLGKNPEGASGAQPVDTGDEVAELSRTVEMLGAVTGSLAYAREGMGKLSRDARLIAAAAEKTVEAARGQAEAATEAAKGLPGIARTVSMAAESATRGLAVTREGSRSMERFLERIHANVEGTRTVEQSTSRIEEVVSLIGDVADQTELLSLNAAIEAARAGEAGRGFTVVAQQVRKLADRSARAASEISELIQSVLGVVNRISVDSREALESVQARQRDLEVVSRSILDMAELAGTAAKEVAPTGAAIERISALASANARGAQDLRTAGMALQDSVEQLARGLSSAAGLGPGSEIGPALAEGAPAVRAGPSTLAIAPVIEPAPTALFIESDRDLVELPPAEDAFPVEEAPVTAGEDLEELEPVKE